MTGRGPPLPRLNCATGLVDAHVAEQVEASVLRADWPAPPGVHALTTLRGPAGESAGPLDRFNMGLRCGDDPAAALDNRLTLQLGADLPSSPHWLRQVHGTRVWRANDALPRPLAGEGTTFEPEADAAVTDVPGIVLAVFTADCLPVLLCADDGSEVAAAHAGWRGLAAGVLEATVAAMHAPSERLMAWLGPAAGPEHYEVGAEVRDAFVSHDRQAATAFVATRPGHWHADLYALARQRLTAAGLTQVHGGGLCTISDQARFFSHRRDQRTGRMASLVWIGSAA